MKDSQPSKECNGFDLKIRSKYVTWYDYGAHLLRMMKRAITFEEMKNSNKYVSFNRLDDVTVFENGQETKMSMNEFNKIFYKKLYAGGLRYRLNYTLLQTEEDVVKAFDEGHSVKIYISK